MILALARPLEDAQVEQQRVYQLYDDVDRCDVDCKPEVSAGESSESAHWKRHSVDLNRVVHRERDECRTDVGANA